VFWNVFRRSPADTTANDDWWRDANAASLAPDRTIVDRLRSAIDPATTSPDEVENRQEMVDGLDALLALTSADALPTILTQHRVIGTDTCHLFVPATRAGEVAVPGKIFLTSGRLIFAGGRAESWAWHRVRKVTRSGRDVLVILAGSEGGIHLQCNSHGDALLVSYVASRLSAPR